MSLRDSTAIVYGAGGSLGGAVARALPGEGAMVFVTRRTLDPPHAVASDIAAGGGKKQKSPRSTRSTRGR
jgi:NAD(P)-dependent dehydrogenase (short-subunit alcohol dehydrogenase family)